MIWWPLEKASYRPVSQRRNRPSLQAGPRARSLTSRLGKKLLSIQRPISLTEEGVLYFEINGATVAIQMHLCGDVFTVCNFNFGTTTACDVVAATSPCPPHRGWIVRETAPPSSKNECSGNRTFQFAFHVTDVHLRQLQFHFQLCSFFGDVVSA